MASLWGEEFDTKDAVLSNAKKALSKIKKPKEISVQKAIKSKQLSIDEKMALISKNVHSILGVYEKNTTVIRDRATFVEYIDKSIENGIIAVDTETNNSLDPITCKLMGLCLYTPGMKNAYIPVNHVNKDTGELLPNQLTEEDIKQQLDRLGGTKIIMHNGKFDYEVIKCTCDCKLKVYWDTMLGARLLDENEMSAGLKQQYISKIDSSIQKYSIEHLFEGMEYAIFDPELFALYAATDAYMTYELYLWQWDKFNIPEHKRLLSLMLDVEMPIMEVSAEMELTGVCIDKEFAKKLSVTYHKKLEEISVKIQEELKRLKPMVDKWRLSESATFKAKIYATAADMKDEGVAKKFPEIDNKGRFKYAKSKNEQLDDPISTTSPTQLAILFYDILGVPEVYDKKAKKMTRPTGEEAMKAMEYPICKLILEERETNKLLGTYIDKLPECLNPKTGRLHASFMQLGTDTGRFSSKDPNLQNIPSHVNSIRMMFVPTEGYAMVGCDYSQQEPRILSSLSADPEMMGAYINGKDIYATMGKMTWNNDYWDNMEHHEDGTPNVEGKKRRKAMKVLFLGRP